MLAPRSCNRDRRSMFPRMVYIAVSGPGDGPHASEDVLHAARRVGELLAAEGAIVLCGGLDGAMAAVARLMTSGSLDSVTWIRGRGGGAFSMSNGL